MIRLVQPILEVNLRDITIIYLTTLILVHKSKRKLVEDGSAHRLQSLKLIKMLCKVYNYLSMQKLS